MNCTLSRPIPYQHLLPTVGWLGQKNCSSFPRSLVVLHSVCCTIFMIEKDVFFILSRAWDKEKILRSMRNQTSDLQIPCSNALPLSHRDSTVGEVYYKVHMTHVLHTTRISNVISVMFVDRNKRDSIRTP